MTAPRTRTRRLAAIVLAVSVLAALLPAGASAAAPAERIRAEPEHGYAVIRGVGGPEGIVMLEERPAGLFVGIGMTNVRFRAVSLFGATAPCGDVGFSTVRLGTFHPVQGRFAAGYIAGNADAVDAIASVRLMAGDHLVACKTLVWGDRDGVSCDDDPGQPDCPRREYVAPEVADFAKLLRLGVIPIVGERIGVGATSVGEVILTVLFLEKAAYRIAFGDASCADGGGTKLAAMRISAGFGVQGMVVQALPTVATVKSAWIYPSGGPTTCVDGTPHQRSAP